MLIVVSPAKSLDYESPLATKKRSDARMLDESSALVEIMATKSPDEIGDLMSISPALAELNFDRFQEWQPPFDETNSRQALLAFDGDVYQGMDARATFGERDFTRAQKTLRILSGLYGVLRPLDMMAPYRLEMGTRLLNDRGSDLYGFWGGRVTDVINEDLAASPGTKALVNLASNEYFGAVQPARVDGRIISPVFLDSKDGRPPKIISFFAKRARGVMAGWLIKERINSTSAIKDFDGMGYRYDDERSSVDRPTFVRNAP